MTDEYVKYVKEQWGGTEIIMSNNKGLEDIMDILSKPNEVKNKTMNIRKKHGKDNSHISLNTIIAMDYACWLK